jgi:hypothetical protein
MSLRIKYMAACDCGGTMSSTTLDLSQEPSTEVEIDLDMLGDIILECDGCNDRAYLPDLRDYIQDVDQ